MKKQKVQLTKWDLVKYAIVNHFKDNPKTITVRKHDLRKLLPPDYKESSLDRYLSALTARKAIRHKKNKYYMTMTIKQILQLPMDLSGEKKTDQNIKTFLPEPTTHLGRHMQGLPAKPTAHMMKEKEPIIITRTPRPQTV